MDDMNRVLDKLDKLTEKQEEMNQVLVRLTVTVEEHEKRSTNLEKIVNSNLEKEDTKFKEVEKKMDKFQTFMDKLGGGVALVGIFSIIISIITTIIKFFK